MHRFRRILGKTLATPILGVIVWTGGGALVWATGGLIFGVFFGAVSALTHAEPWRIVSMGVYFALCGAATGTITGVFRAICDNQESYAWADNEVNPAGDGGLTAVVIDPGKTPARRPATDVRFGAGPAVRSWSRFWKLSRR